MLVLSRKQGQEIVIAGSIRVVVLDVCGSRVKLGFIAPPQMTVLRSEVHVAKRATQDAAAQPHVGA